MTGHDQAPQDARRVAVITGASRGIGAGLARAFAARGMALGLCARTPPETPAGAEAVSASVDVARAESVEAFGSAVVDRFGRVDLWVNNAGLLFPIGPLADLDPGAVKTLLEVNVLGVVHGTAWFARHVRSRPGGGVVVNMTSGAAANPSAGWAPYCASKAAVDMLTEVVAVEEAAAGLRAYALAPGVVDTDMQALIRSTPPDAFPSVGRFLRLKDEGRFNTPAWVATYIVDHLLDRTDGGRRPADPADPVRLRVPDRPGPDDGPRRR